MRARSYWSLSFFTLLIVLSAHFWATYALAGPIAYNNTLIIWTEKDRLKAVTVLSVSGASEPVGIIGVPVFVHVSQGGAGSTISEIYARSGKDGLRECLEEQFNTRIGNYLIVDQSTLDKTSEIIGPVMMDGKQTTMSDVFEGAYTCGYIEPQNEIRMLAARLVEPGVLVKAPQLAWILTTEVATDLGYKNIWNIYRVVADQGPGILQKKILMGSDYYVNNRVYRVVPPEAWAGSLKIVTEA